MVGDHIYFRTTHTIEIHIGVQRVRRLGILHRHVNLPCDALITLRCAPGAFTDVDCMHPIPRYVFQSFNYVEASRTGHVIHLKLAVFSMQTQHTDLPGSSDCIRE